MTPTYHLYIDDSGSRDLDRNLDTQDGSKWFALGGIILAEKDEEAVRDAHASFVGRWPITAPLHSYDIRMKAEEFEWLKDLSESDLKLFIEDLSKFLLELPVIGIAAVIDRLGYYNRYKPTYGDQRWSLCKTAFTIVTERAAKFAHDRGHRLKVFYERSDRENERKIETYYEGMRRDGMPFNPDTSAKYAPLTGEQLRHALWEIKKKAKSSPPMQVADLYLFPMCVGGYDPNYRAFVALKERQRIIDCLLPNDAVAILGVKYSCFEYR